MAALSYDSLQKRLQDYSGLMQSSEQKTDSFLSSAKQSAINSLRSLYATARPHLTLSLLDYNIRPYNQISLPGILNTFPQNDILGKSLVSCDAYETILSEGIPSKKILQKEYKILNKELTLLEIKNKGCALYPGYGKRIMAKIIYYTRYWSFFGERKVITKILKEMEDINSYLECGKVHLVYFRLLERNKEWKNEKLENWLERAKGYLYFKSFISAMTAVTKVNAGKN